jgi:hypothetical protein
MVLIYLLDSVGPFNVRAAVRMAALRAAGDVPVFSDLTRLECRIKPIRIGATKALADFDAFFLRPDVQFVPITTAVFDRATLIRAAHNFPTRRLPASGRRGGVSLRSLPDQRRAPLGVHRRPRGSAAVSAGPAAGQASDGMASCPNSRLGTRSAKLPFRIPIGGRTRNGSFARQSAQTGVWARGARSAESW